MDLWEVGRIRPGYQCKKGVYGMDKLNNKIYRAWQINEINRLITLMGLITD